MGTALGSQLQFTPSSPHPVPEAQPVKRSEVSNGRGLVTGPQKERPGQPLGPKLSLLRWEGQDCCVT